MKEPEHSYSEDWSVQTIAVVGAGIVGIPMAALLAESGIKIGSDEPARVVVLQRPSPTSGWKVEALNAGRSPIGGLEPDLDDIVWRAVAAGRLRASHDYAEAAEADVILICVQTDKKSFAPDYGPLQEAVTSLGVALETRVKRRPPLIIFESTLAPTTMATWVSEQFARFGLEDGRSILLGNSPNRVMPGRLVERIRTSDKLVGGLNPETTRRILALYAGLVTRGTLHSTNSLTAEVVKTLENAYRDVRIAFTSDIARYCDDHDLDFCLLRRAVNERLESEESHEDASPRSPTAAGAPGFARGSIPPYSPVDLRPRASGEPGARPLTGLMVPTIGVGGHCLPKDGILLLWRTIESGEDVSDSLILEARRINEESPEWTISRLETLFGDLRGQSLALMGTAYRPDSEDTRNSPTLVLGRKLLDRGSRVVLHDPYVKPGDQNLLQAGLTGIFTNEPKEAIGPSDIIVFCAAHAVYAAEVAGLASTASASKRVFDGCGLTAQQPAPGLDVRWPGLGRGRTRPVPEFIEFVVRSFRIMETGAANELLSTVEFLNRRTASDDFNRIDFDEVRSLAGTCVTGCRIAEPAGIPEPPSYGGFVTRLARRAREADSRKRRM